MTVSRDQRFTRNRRCPICGGCESDDRGKGKRCTGFLSTDGAWCHCSREEHAGDLDQDDAQTYSHRMRGPCNCGETHGEAMPDGIEAVYPYVDESGQLLFEVVRKTGKQFRQRKPDGAGGFEWKLNGVRRVPYRLTEIIAADPARPVFVVEGEKDADNLRSRGELATCNAGGAGKWHTVADTARAVLSGRDVIVIADKDDPGRKHAQDVARSLSGYAQSVRVMEVPTGKDVSDYFASGKTTSDLALAIANTPEWSSGVNPSQDKPTTESPPLDDPRFAENDPAPTKRWEWVKGADIFAPLPPVLWTVPGIFLCPGRPFQIQGFGYSGKTVAAQSLLLSVATGLPVWGKFSVKQGIALHIDCEVGKRGTLGRYQRLSYTDQIVPDMVEDRLRIMPLPDFRLTDADAEEILLRECEGASVCMLDSFRALLGGGVDENSSDARLPIDKLLRVSETTGCAFILLHHTGKGRRDGEAKEAGRGSSAIYDAAGTVLKMDAEKHDEPQVTISRVEMSKVTAEASGGALEPFWLRIEDVADDRAVNMRAGLRCAHLEAFEPSVEDAGATAKRKEAIIDLMKDHPTGLSPRQIEGLVKGQREITRRAMILLELDRAVKVEKRAGKGGGSLWILA